MPSKSKQQQKFFGIVRAIQKGEAPASSFNKKAQKAAKDMKKSDVKKYAKTKHKGLPKKVKQETKVRNLIRKMVREIMKEDFAGAHPKGKRDSFNKMREKQSEVLGYTLTGKSDIKVEIDDATVKEGKLAEAGVNVWYFYKKANKDKNKFFKMLSDFRKKHSDTKWIKMLNYALKDFNENPKKYKTIDDKQNILFKNLQNNKKVYEGKLTEDYKNSEWEVYVSDEPYYGREKIVKKVKSKRAAVILYNKLIKTDKYAEVGMRVIKEGKLTEDWDSDVKTFGKKSGIKVKPHRGTLGAYGAKPVKPEISKKVVPFFKSKGYKVTYQKQITSGAYKGDWVFELQGKDKKKYMVSVNTNDEGTNINFRLSEGKLIESRVAKTILQQLGGNKFIAMTGAKNLGASGKSLSMKIGRNSKSITHVIIKLTSMDLYDIEFIRMRGAKRTVVKKVKGIYADMLQKIFTKYTGLRTRL